MTTKIDSNTNTKSVEPLNDSIVKMNVGGKIFHTTKQTLSTFPESFLYIMIDNKVGVMKDDDGNYFIDRDPEYFRYVLDYYRLKDKIVDKLDDQAIKELTSEFDFYLLPKLNIESLEHKISHNTLLSEAKHFAVFNNVDTSFYENYTKIDKFLIMNKIAIKFYVSGSPRRAHNKLFITSITLFLWTDKDWIKLIDVAKDLVFNTTEFLNLPNLIDHYNSVIKLVEPEIICALNKK